MTLRGKSFLLVVVTTAALIIVLYTVMQVFLLAGFAQVEGQNTKQNMQRALNALSVQFQALVGKASSAANSDDTYDFARNGDPTNLIYDLTDPRFSQLGVNLMAVIQPSGRVLFAKDLDSSGKPIPLAPELL
jgi:sensor domain CHASE-containing protein